MTGYLPMVNYQSQADVEINYSQRAKMVEVAILRTLAYGDVFDYAMTVTEIYRYLESARAYPHAIAELLKNGGLLTQHTRMLGKYVCLRGREELAELRHQRQAIATTVWPKARHYAGLITLLPFVRMVAVTGSLAVNNPAQTSDIDYLVVTAPGRVWLCRAMIIAIVRWAAQYGDLICPNYILSENALASDHRDLYSAHEFAQMVPLVGLETYYKMRHLNRWTNSFLPNASGCPPETTLTPTVSNRALFLRAKAWSETGLSGRIGDFFEEWEMGRKVRRLASQSDGYEEADFCADWCKGHFEGYAGRVMAAYRNRLREFGLR
jgi:hypothetical protein